MADRVTVRLPNGEIKEVEMPSDFEPTSGPSVALETTFERLIPAPNNQVPEPSSEIGYAGQVGYPLYGAAQGALFNRVDELLALASPKLSQTLETGYRDFQSQYPGRATASEIVGALAPALTPVTAIGMLPRATQGAATALRALHQLGSEGKLLSGIGGLARQAFLSGTGAPSAIPPEAEAPMFDPLAQLTNQYRPASGELASEALRGPTTSERIGSGLISAATGTVLGTPLIVGAKLLQPSQKQITAKLIEKLNIPEEIKKAAELIVRKEPDITPTELLKRLETRQPTTLAEDIGGEAEAALMAGGSEVPAVRRSMETRRAERPKRIKAAVEEAYGIGQEFTPSELTEMAKESARQAVEKGQARATAAAKPTYEALEWRKKVTEKSLEDIKESGFQGDEIVYDFLQNMRKAVDNDIGRQAIKAAFRDVKRKPLKELTFEDYKKIRSTLKDLKNAVSQGREPEGLKGTLPRQVVRVEQRLNQILRQAVPGLRRADALYRAKYVPEGFGGMSEVVRKKVTQISRVTGENVQKIGDIVLSLDPKQVSEIIAGAKKMDSPELINSLKQGLQAKMKEIAATTDRAAFNKIFSKGENGRDIADILLGKEPAQKLLKTLSTEQKMASLEGQIPVTGGAKTFPMAQGAKALEEIEQPIALKIFNRLRNFVSSPKQGALDEIEGLLADSVNPALRKQIITVLSAQGKEKAKAGVQIAMYLRALKKAAKASPTVEKKGRILTGGVAPRIINVRED